MENGWIIYLVLLGIILLVLTIYFTVLEIKNKSFSLGNVSKKMQIAFVVFIFIFNFVFAYLGVYGIIYFIDSIEAVFAFSIIEIILLPIIAIILESVITFILNSLSKSTNKSNTSAQQQNDGKIRCQRCGKTVFTYIEFTAKLNAMGLNLTPDGRITATGVFDGYGTLQNIQQTVAQMESDKAIQCTSCGKVYCVDCLAKYAPSNVMSGGKMCPSCGGSFKEI